MRKIAQEHPGEINLPDEILNEAPPEPRIWHEMIWDAWRALKNDRAYPGDGLEMPIPYRAYREYGRDKGIHGDDFDFFLTMMQAVDSEYLTWRYEVRKRELNKAKPAH